MCSQDHIFCDKEDTILWAIAISALQLWKWHIGGSLARSLIASLLQKVEQKWEKWTSRPLNGHLMVDDCTGKIQILTNLSKKLR